jgi:hypothetical protein
MIQAIAHSVELSCVQVTRQYVVGIDFQLTRIDASTANLSCARRETVDAIGLALPIAVNSVASNSVKTGSLCIVSRSTLLLKLFSASVAKRETRFGTAGFVCASHVRTTAALVRSMVATFQTSEIVAPNAASRFVWAHSDWQTALKFVSFPIILSKTQGIRKYASYANENSAKELMCTMQNHFESATDANAKFV